ncbi:MAG: hypothetical protein IKC69_03945 [Clostridia bacterium]|nr:hypothetical protein [Clostridia bacterium]
MYELFMEFENPTEAFLGKRTSVQGFAVHGDNGFLLFHSGVAAVYDLISKKKEPISVFKLGSFHDGVPDKRYANHANDAMFGAHLVGEEFPLLYVTAGNSGESDERGFIGYCAVEQLRREEDGFTSETVQRIYYKNEGIENTPYEAPGWGWPAWLVDVEGGWCYTFSARYRTRKEFSKPDNVYIVTKFPLPDPTSGDVTLTPKDILEQFTLPFHVFITQGGTIRNGKLWYTFGFGREEYPNALRMIDLKEKKYELCEDLGDTPFADEEVECCAFYREKLLINTQKCKIFERL